MVSNLDARGYNFRFSEQQWLEFARFVDFIYEQQRRHTDDLVRPVILRAVGQSQVVYDRGVSASSLADALDLPRETVRRKCLAMVEEGWLTRDGDDFRLGERVDPEIFALFEENIARLLATARKLDAAGE
jgi:hypothetical protein